jgi:hypothetical protein
LLNIFIHVGHHHRFDLGRPTKNPTHLLPNHLQVVGESHHPEPLRREARNLLNLVSPELETKMTKQVALANLHQPKERRPNQRKIKTRNL